MLGYPKSSGWRLKPAFKRKLFFFCFFYWRQEIWCLFHVKRTCVVKKKIQWSWWKWYGYRMVEKSESVETKLPSPRLVPQQLLGNWLCYQNCFHSTHKSSWTWIWSLPFVVCDVKFSKQRNGLGMREDKGVGIW